MSGVVADHVAIVAHVVALEPTSIQGAEVFDPVNVQSEQNFVSHWMEDHAMKMSYGNNNNVRAATVALVVIRVLGYETEQWHRSKTIQMAQDNSDGFGVIV